MVAWRFADLSENVLRNEYLLFGCVVWQRSQCESDAERLADVAGCMVRVHIAHAHAFQRQVQQRGGRGFGVRKQRRDVGGLTVGQRALLLHNTR